MAERLEQRVPALGQVSFAHRWHGTAALTPDLLPRRIPIGTGAEGLVACNGRGLVMTTVLAEALADFCLGHGDAPLRPALHGPLMGTRRPPPAEPAAAARRPARPP